MNDAQIYAEYIAICASRPQPLPANAIARKSPYKRRHTDYLTRSVPTQDDSNKARESEDKHDERF